jgi:predicted lipid-binding transport protein (Tim44 family)
MSVIMARRGRLGTGALVVAAVVALAPVVAEARVGGGGSSGSRGFKTWTSPPATRTAPKPAQPIERSITPQAGKQQQGATAGMAQQAARPGLFGGMFSGGLGKLLMGGLIAGALASILGMGALASVLGFLLQMALIAGIVLLVVTWWRNRSAARPAMTSTGPRVAGMGTSGPNGPSDLGRNDFRRDAASYRSANATAGSPGSLAAGLGRGSAPPIADLEVRPADLDAFERLLGEIQTAYGRNDVKALETRATPEMLSYFAQQLSDNAARGVRNEVSGVKLLQGDLAEAWREGNLDYATVAMRFSLVDATVEVASGRVVDGSRSEPQEVTELWTFVRSSAPRGGQPASWELSAIQQTA